jgi:ribosomal protein L29
MTFDLSVLSDDQMKALQLLVQQQMETRKVTFDDQVSAVQQQRFADRMKEVERSIAQIETVNAAFEVCLNDILGDIEESRWIVSQLDKCRRENDFRRFNSVHFKYRGKDLKVEEMLKTLAAIYRLKTKKYTNSCPKYSDRAIVRKEIRCPHCGEYAAKLVKFLEIKGIRWADL